MLQLSYTYTGRSIDVLMVDPPASITGAISLTYPRPSKICTGVQKLAQKFIIVLLTAPDTQPFEVGRGTLLGSMVHTSVAIRRNLIEHACLSSVKSARDTIVEDQTDDTPGDEYLIDAELKDFAFTANGGISFTVEMTTRDNTVYIIPLSIGSLT